MPIHDETDLSSASKYHSQYASSKIQIDFD